MSNRVLRGSGLGGVSFEDDRGVEFAPRQMITYDCPRGHVVEVTMAHDAEVPAVWECPHCGSEAARSTGEKPEPKQEKLTARTGTCCVSVAASPSWRSCWRSESSC